MKNLVFAFSLFCAGAAFAAVPTVTVDSAAQDARHVLVVNWTLSGAPGYVTLDVLTNGVSVGGAVLGNVKGEVNGFYAVGPHVFTWKPGRTDLEQRDFEDGTVKVVLTAHSPADAPLYCVTDLASGTMRYYETEALLPFGPLKRSGTDEELLGDPYRTTLLVLRKISATGLPFQVGASGSGYAFRAVLSHDYYMAVYAMTQRQHQTLTGSTSSQDVDKTLSPVKPVDLVNSWSAIRGTEWPDGGHGTVGDGTPIDRLRKLTGAAFDQPTQAEWEFAARGTGTQAGDYGPTNDLSVIDACAWHAGNAGGETHPVGLKLPNVNGLYDMYGNVCEWVLDRRSNDYGVDANARKALVVDPIGAAQSVDSHIKKGGSYRSPAHEATATQVDGGNWDNYRYECGYRLCLPVGGETTEAPADVDLYQDADSKIVTIRYTLDEEAVVTLDIETNGVSIGASNVMYAWGDVNRLLPPGAHTIKWPAARSWPGHGELGGFSAKVVKWPRSSPPDYAVTAVDGGMKQHTAYYADVSQLPLGVTNELYKSQLLVLKRVHAAGRVWTVGSPTTEANREGREMQHRVTFSQDYYLGVYETTQRQYQRALDIADDKMYSYEACYKARDDWALLPMNSNAQWYASTALRGRTDWPNGGHEVTSGSPLGKFSARTGFAFDLPTEAEWEVACRAGTQTPWICDLSEIGNYAWYKDNSGGVLHEVGTRRPNGWGFYDMMGNVCEYCLQWVDGQKPGGDTYGLTAEQLAGVTIDPTGPSSSECISSTRVNHGGCFSTSTTTMRSAARGTGNNGSWSCGFRLCTPAYAQ